MCSFYTKQHRHTGETLCSPDSVHGSSFNRSPQAWGTSVDGGCSLTVEGRPRHNRSGRVVVRLRAGHPLSHVV